jgi:Ca-activated chloride channel family protein
MDGEGRAAAAAAVRRLADRGGTNLWEGWCAAAEEVATAMQQDPRASHRVLLLSDGQANEGITDPAELARHTRALLERGIVTSAVGIGDGYDEAVLGGMAEAGGGRLHDAEHAPEIAEVVLGELMEGRSALLERTVLRIAVPARLRAELVGPWTHTAVPGGLEVLVGTLLPEVPMRIVVRLHAPAGEAGATFRIGATAEGSLPDGAGTVAAAPADCALTLARSGDNNAQARDEARAVAVMMAWQSQAIRRALAMNRDADRRGAKHYLERELRFLERYARGLPGAEGILAELVLLLRRAEEELDPRLRKELYATTVVRSLSRADHRSAPRAPLADLLRKDEA